MKNFDRRIVFRFDIDTHVCIRDGVSALIQLASKYNVHFNFFLNTGRAISFWSSLKSLLDKHNKSDTAPHLSAFQKLGFYEYLYTALINPKLISYKAQILTLLESNHEVGLHGGKNHELWAKKIHYMDFQSINNELKEALSLIHKIKPDYNIEGFASPCWQNTEILNDVLIALGFRYAADIHTLDHNLPIQYYKTLPCIPTNLTGEPGGIAYFEYCRAKRMTDQEIIDDFFSKIMNQKNFSVVYDHPYFVGKYEIPLLEKLIVLSREKGFTITTLGNILQ